MPYTTTEKVNADVCDKLANLQFGDFQKIYADFHNGGTNSDKNGRSEKDLLIIYKRVKKYCRLAQSQNYQVKQTYHFAEGMNSGRLFSTPGIQSMPKAIRGALCDGINNDFDAKNCHPTLLLYYTRQNNILTNYLAQYVINRNQILMTIASELKTNIEDVKELFIISMNSNKYLDTYGKEKKKIKNETLIGFDKEMKQIQQAIMDNPVNEPLKSKLISADFRNKENLAGSLLNHILCNLENEMLDKITDYCEREGLEVHVKCFDGLMLGGGELETHQRAEIIRQFDLITAPYGIKWAHKQHLLGFKTQLLSTKPINGKISYCADNIIHLSKHVFQTCFKNRLYSVPSANKENRLFMKSLDSNLYITGNDNIYSQIKNWVCEQDLYISIAPGEYVPIIQNHKNPDAITTRIIELSASEYQGDFMKNLVKKSYNKLNFRNGVLEVIQDKKTKKVNYDFQDDPTLCEGLFKIEYDLDLNGDYTHLKQEIFNRILNPIWACDGIPDYLDKKVAEGVRDCMLYRLARAVFGVGMMDKNGFFKCEGVRSSGKGILSQLFHTTIGDYCQSVSSSNFITKPQLGDAARNYAFLADQEFTRILYTNEFEVQRNQFVNGSLIKSIIGRDTLEVRKLHENPFYIDTQLCLWMFANQYPEFVPKDCLEDDMATPWNMPSKFIKKTENQKLIPGYAYYERDDDLKEWIRNPDNNVGLGFILILLDYVIGEPKNMPEIIREEIALDNETSTTEIINPLARFYEYSPNETDYVYVRDIKQKLVSNNINLSDRLIKSYMILLGCRPKRMGESRCSAYTKCIAI